MFTDKQVRNYRDILAADATIQGKFNTSLRERGFFKLPSKIYPSLALNVEDLEATEKAIKFAANYLLSDG